MAEPSEIAEKAEQIYEEQIRPELKPEDKGKFVVIDTVSGDYELDEKDVAATSRLLERHEDGSKFFHIRVGHRTAYLMLGSRFHTAGNA